jgi:hypothetical protein
MPHGKKLIEFFESLIFMNEVIAKSNGILLPELVKIFSPLDVLDSERIQVFVHGSWADNTRTAFSDLDDFIIVEDSYYETAKGALEKVELIFQQLDPIQHHGHWLIKRSQLKNYNNSFMPLHIMDNAICIKGKNIIHAVVNSGKSLEGLVNNIKVTCRNIENFYSQFKKGELNIYNMKCFVGSICLMPPMVFQLLGRNIDKRNAILQASDIYSIESIRLLEWATNCRNKWSNLLNCNEYIELNKKLSKFINASDWRRYLSSSAPVINDQLFSEIELVDSMIESFITESLNFIDKVKFKRFSVKDYEKGYEKIQEFAIENKATIVGQFGSIKYPSISDLDVFICFEDADYHNGCQLINRFIEQDEILSYLFTHSPVYVNRSFLGHIKYLHTLYDLQITYNPQNIEIDKELDKDYIQFLNIIWSYAFFSVIDSLRNDGLRYFDIRSLLLILKNIHTSIDNFEKYLGLETSNSLLVSNSIRKNVMEGDLSRSLIENTTQEAIDYFDKLLLLSDNRLNITGNRIMLNGYVYLLSNRTSTRFESGLVKKYVNKIYFQLIRNIMSKKDLNSKIYLNSLRMNYENHRKFGGEINKFMWVIPDIYVTHTLVQRQVHFMKKKIKRSIKRGLEMFTSLF